MATKTRNTTNRARRPQQPNFKAAEALSMKGSARESLHHFAEALAEDSRASAVHVWACDDSLTLVVGAGPGHVEELDFPCVLDRRAPDDVVRAWIQRAPVSSDTSLGRRGEVLSRRGLRAVCHPVVWQDEVCCVVEVIRPMAAKVSAAVSKKLSDFLESHASALASALRMQDFEDQVTNGDAARRATVAVQEGQTEDEMVDAALSTICQNFGWEYGSYWTVDEAQGALVFARESGTVSEAFKQVTRSASFAKGVGLSGRTWAKGDVVAVEDLGELQDCCRRESAQAAGVRSGVCLPIKVDGEIVATMDFFMTRYEAVSKHRQDCLRDMASALSVALKRVRAARAMKEIVTRADMLESAVDNGQRFFMVVDRDFKVQFMNQASRALLEKHSEKFRHRWPAFDVDSVMGSSVDFFHKNPAHQRNMLDDPSKLPMRHQIDIEGLKFYINVAAIVDADGEYIGNSMELEDVTSQMDAESQIGRLIAQASSGELEGRLEASSWEGFLGKVGQGINELLDVVVKPLAEVQEGLGRLSEGALDFEMSRDHQGQFGQMASSYNHTVETLRDTVGKILKAAAGIGDGVSQISAGNNDLSSRTQEQAAAIEETAATVVELTGTVKQNATNAGEATQLAVHARSAAEDGGKVVGSAVGAMQEINKSSKRIADIIGVIDEIAFQTNLLALNAAVEAARAGEQGRGFAVVAGEVRNLAQRSAEAAKEIKGLINDSVEKVEEGSRLVDQSGETLGDIIKNVTRVSDIIAEISAASNEQATAIEQVNTTVGQMDQNTQQNAGLVEEAAAASMSVNREAQQMRQMMAFFKMGEGELEVVADEPMSVAPAPPVTRAKPSAGQVPAAVAASRTQESDDWQEF
ncbi:MAG: methyl-accepting chemotaxis protein [Myxococcota bacterium]